MADELVSVRFIRKQVPYLAGDLAGFPASAAQRLVAGGVATYVEPPPGLDEFGRPFSPEEEEPKAKGRKASSKSKEDAVSDEKEKAELDKRKTGDPGTVKK
jgi:hypothetical protein